MVTGLGRATMEPTRSEILTAATPVPTTLAPVPTRILSISGTMPCGQARPTISALSLMYFRIKLVDGFSGTSRRKHRPNGTSSACWTMVSGLHKCHERLVLVGKDDKRMERHRHCFDYCQPSSACSLPRRTPSRISPYHQVLIHHFFSIPTTTPQKFHSHWHGIGYACIIFGLEGFFHYLRLEPIARHFRSLRMHD
jgi:hypothetical protein